MEVTYWICNLLIVTILLHRQLLTSKQLRCWLGSTSAVLKGPSCMRWPKCRGIPEVQTPSGRVWQQKTSWKWLADSAILEHFQSWSLLLLSVYFSLPKMLCWQEWWQLPSTLALCNFASWNLFFFQKDPPSALCFHRVLFTSLRISVFFHFVTSCLKQYLNYIVILAWFFLSFFFLFLFAITCCFLFRPLK